MDENIKEIQLYFLKTKIKYWTEITVPSGSLRYFKRSLNLCYKRIEHYFSQIQSNWELVQPLVQITSVWAFLQPTIAQKIPLKAMETVSTSRSWGAYIKSHLSWNIPISSGENWYRMDLGWCQALLMGRLQLPTKN